MTSPSPSASARILLRLRDASAHVSPELYGIFIEDINHACDGGLNANLVNNHSFEGVYADPGTVPYASPELTAEIGAEAVAQLVALTPRGRTIHRDRHWTVHDGRIEIVDDAPTAPGTWFARIASDGAARVENDGYPGGVRAMGFTGPMRFSAWVRADRYEGDLVVNLIDHAGALLDSVSVPLTQAGWTRVAAVLTPPTGTRGALHLALPGKGSLDIDEVSLVAVDHWGAGDPRWSQGLLRHDLVEALRDLAPGFVRFPGGCLVEGCGDGSHYRWKDTLGPLERRRPEYNLWGQFVTDGDYSQSNQIGFYEYFLLCEDLGAEPIPVVWTGISCQVRTDTAVPMDSAEFDAVVQDALDLIEWATGDPASSPWAALRAEAGHPEPFPLRFIGIGNENHGPGYRARAELIRAALEARRPGMTYILSTASPDASDTAHTWDLAREHGENFIVDEHFYYSAEWMIAAASRYDHYPRGTARVMIGEWSGFPPNVIGADRTRVSTVEPGADPEEPNSWASALAEAAFLTGVERNSDVVALVSFAPLLNLVGHGQWAHNLINFNPTAVGPTVNYLVQQLFATHLGERIVPFDMELPDRVHMSATAGDTTCFVKLVNTGAEATTIALTLDQKLDDRVPGIELQAGFTAANHLDFDGPFRPEVTPSALILNPADNVLFVPLPPTSVIVLRVPIR